MESEERFRLLVGSVKDYAIFMLDPAGNIVGTLPKGVTSLFPIKVLARPNQSLLCLPTEPNMRYDYQAAAIDTAGDEHPALDNTPRFTGSIAADSLMAGVIPVIWNHWPPSKAAGQSIWPGRAIAMALPARS